MIGQRDWIILGFESARSVLAQHLKQGLTDTSNLIASGRGQSKQDCTTFYAFATNRGAHPYSEWRVSETGGISVTATGWSAKMTVPFST